MRRIILVTSSIAGAILLVAFVVGGVFLRTAGYEATELGVYWLRVFMLFFLALVFLVPLVLWAGTGVNILRTPGAKSFVPLMGIPIGILLGGKDAQPAFYEVGAQIIPVLLLVLAVEYRAFVVRRQTDSLPAGEEIDKLAAAAVVLGLMAGEGIALWSLALEPGQIPPYAPCAVVVAVAMGFLSVLTYSILGEPKTG